MQYGFVIAVALTASWAIGSTAAAQQDGSTEQVTSSPVSNPDQELGRRFLIKAENLPPPKSDPVAARGRLRVGIRRSQSFCGSEASGCLSQELGAASSEDRH